MRALLHLLEEESTALEASLRSEYQVDLGGVYTGDLTLRQLYVYFKHLPADSPVKWKLATGDYSDARWNTTDFLLASVIDWQQFNTWVSIAKTGTKPHFKLTDVQIARPGQQKRPTKPEELKTDEGFQNALATLQRMRQGRAPIKELNPSYVTIDAENTRITEGEVTDS